MIEKGASLHVYWLSARSTAWRCGRLLPVLAALDELRRLSAKPEELGTPEAA